jgi:hypothetical protein
MPFLIRTHSCTLLSSMPHLEAQHHTSAHHALPCGLSQETCSTTGALARQSQNEELQVEGAQWLTLAHMNCFAPVVQPLHWCYTPGPAHLGGRAAELRKVLAVDAEVAACSAVTGPLAVLRPHSGRAEAQLSLSCC